MDAHTLAVNTLLFFVLYAVSTLVYRTMYRAMPQAARGCDWFIASNLVLALPYLELVCPAFFPYRTVTHSAVIFALMGHLFLHRSFAALRGREWELWWPQVGVFSAGVGIWAAMVLGRWPESGTVWMTAISGMQYGLIGYMMFRPAAGVGRSAGWFAGGASAIYAASHFVWFGLEMFFPQRGWGASGHRWTAVLLVTHASLAVSFLLLSVSRLHIQMHRDTELDELTGLLNLRAIRRAAAVAIAYCAERGRSVSVVMIDLDEFKAANDRMGHDAGDVLLCGVANALKGRLRELDKVARLGGDEFCLLLPGTDQEEAVRVAERCRATLAEMTILYGGERLRVTASFGVAHADAGDADWDELLRRGDRVMYEAKREGGNRVGVGGGGVSSLLTMQGRVWPGADYMEATGRSIRSSASATSFWTKGSA